MLVNSRGIAASCESRPAKIVSDTHDFDTSDYQNIKNGDSVYVVTTTLLSFITHVLPRLEKESITIKLVTGAADKGAPREISKIDGIDYLNVFTISPAVSLWFTQNYDVQGENDFVHPIPLGLDYHTLEERETDWGPRASAEEQNEQLLSISQESMPFENRLDRTFSFYGFKMYRHRHRGDRYLANDALKNADYNDVLPNPISRLATWQKMAEYKFIISPHGTGLDCHRTYEAVALGCIPVVRSSPLNILYKELPVIILPSWNDISLSRLQEEAAKVKFNSKKSLALSYWIDKIKGS